MHLVYRSLALTVATVCALGSECIRFEAEQGQPPGEPLSGVDTRQFSGRAVLAHKGTTAFRGQWSLSVVSPGTFTLHAREIGWARNQLSAIRWRIDDGAWTEVEQTWGLPPAQPMGDCNWSCWGRLPLTAGAHTLQVESVRPVFRFTTTGKDAEYVGVKMSNLGVEAGEQHVVRIDCFLLTDQAIHPAIEHARIAAANGVTGLDGAPLADGRRPLPIAVDDGVPSLLDRIHPRQGRAIGRGPEERIRVRDGALVNGDGTPFRAWAVSGPDVPSADDADYFARRARRLGVTMVRLHTLDGELCSPWRGLGQNYLLEAARIDRLDYFIAALKREGIYVMFDALYNWVWAMGGAKDGLPEDVTLMSRVRTPFFWDQALQERNRAFVRTLLTHVNPYTGLRWGDDPAVAMFSVVNENGMFFYAVDRMVPYHREMLRGRFNAWLASTYGDRAALAKRWGAALGDNEDPTAGSIGLASIHDLLAAAKAPPARQVRLIDQVRFYHQVQTGFFNSVRDFIRNDLGFRDLLVHGSGWHAPGWLDLLDEHSNTVGMDFYDQHGYSKGDKMPLMGHEDPVPAGDMHPKRHSLLAKFLVKRPAGLPWVATEWNDGGHITGPLVMACYGALQGWDGLFQYRLDTFDGTVNPGTTPPWAHWQYPLASLAFTRGSIATAALARRSVVDEAALFNPARPSVDKGNYGLIGRCDTDYRPGATAVAIDRTPFLRPDGSIASSTGELTWRAVHPAVLIHAGRLAGLVGQADGSAVDLGAVHLRLAPGQVSVSLGSLDGRNLADSSSMLLCAVTETTGSGAGGAFAPYAMQPLVGEVRFLRPVRAVHQLDLSGHRLRPLKLTNGGTTFSLDGASAHPWFEIER